MTFDSFIDDNSAYEQIISLLLDAGYYRVQISTLSPFDKVIGGLTWCITWTGFDVNVGSEVLEFKENANIGYKIALSEKLTSTIVQFGFTLEPHQIQGLDYTRLLPIFRSLTKRVKELREMYGDVHKQYVVYLYDKEFGLDENVTLPESFLPPSSPEALESEPKNKETELNMLQVSLNETNQALAKCEKEKADLERELESLKQMEKKENIRNEVKELLVRKSQLEREAVEFQLKCKKELKQLKKQIKEYENAKDEDDYQHKELNELLKQLEVINMDYQTLQYTLEEIPDNLELEQFQKRFIELFHEMSERLIELRQQINTYNTKESIRAQMNKEKTLLKSVYENIHKINVKQNQDKLLQSLEEWHQIANEVAIKTESQGFVERERLKKASERLALLQDYEKKYHQYVRDFQSFMKKDK